MTHPPGAPERLLLTSEVAALLRVDAATVSRWASTGQIDSLKTPGGRRRYRESYIRALIAGVPQKRAS